MTDERNQEALKQARAQLASIVEYHLAWDALENQYEEEAEADGNTYTDADDVTDDARENLPLSLEVRCAEWHTPGDGYPDADEFRIVLCTGGPHVEIRGKLNGYNEPEDAEIYAQDWFTQLERLQDISEEEREALDWFCTLFYFGDC